jgi:hypothetical protein
MAWLMGTVAGIVPANISTELHMSTAKREVESLLKSLPDDCTLEDVQYHLYVLEKVRRGEERAASEGVLTQSEVETRMSRWLTK